MQSHGNQKYFNCMSNTALVNSHILSVQKLFIHYIRAALIAAVLAAALQFTGLK